MMGTAGLLPALLLPWALGVVWLRAGCRRAGRGHIPLQLGYGFLLGMLVTAAMMSLQDAAGYPQSFPVTGTMLFVVILAGAWFASDVPWTCSADTDAPAVRPIQPKLAQAIILILIVIIAIRVVSLGLEIWWRPLYPWDAWKVWAVKARVWFELKRLVPFVDAATWLSRPGEVYTVEGWHYPATVSLISTWTALAMGRWDGSLVNLPWLACYLALGLGFYGQVRIWGASVLTATVFTYLLLSIPLLNTHVALAGYADLWMTATYASATMSFLQWVRTKDHCQGMLALIFVAACAAIKVEGRVWIVTLVPPLILACTRPSLALGALVLCAGGLVGWWLVGGFTADIVGVGTIAVTPNLIDVPFLGRFELQPRFDWRPYVDNFFLFDNWHLLWFLAIGVIGISLSRVRGNKTLLVGGTLVLSAFVMLLVLFHLTGASAWAADYTAINRLYMHLVPTVLFYVFLLLHDGLEWRRPPRAGTCG